jgi:hypothetical protein
VCLCSIGKVEAVVALESALESAAATCLSWKNRTGEDKVGSAAGSMDTGERVVALGRPVQVHSARWGGPHVRSCITIVERSELSSCRRSYTAGCGCRYSAVLQRVYKRASG